MSRLTRVVTLLVLVVPMLTLASLFVRSQIADHLVSPLIAFCVLVPLQVLVQAIAVWRMAVAELGARRVRRLRVATVVRAAAFALGAAALLLDARTGGTLAWREAGVFLYLTLPLVAIAADLTVLRELGALQRESNALLSGRMAVVPLIARWMLVPIYILCLLPFVGWFMALCGWVLVLSVCFAQVEEVAEASRKALPERRA